MPKAKRPALCHPERDHYAKGMCKSCYITSVRKKSSRQKVDAAYEDRHRKERNEQRRLHAAKLRQQKKDPENP